MLIQTSVVGSFPKLDLPIDVAIKNIVNLQLENGIDVITDGEQRGSMVSYFEQVSGLEKVGNSLRIVNKVDSMEGELDKFYKIRDFEKVKAILSDLNRTDVQIKATFTGPLTLASSCILTDIQSATKHYDLNDKRKIYIDFSSALLPLVNRALDLGAYVQIDEPWLSTGNIEVDSAEDILEYFFAQLPSSFIRSDRISLHICGSIKSVPRLFDILLGLPVPVLSFGFSGEKERENIDIISKRKFEANNKKLGAGFISNIRIENQRTIMDRFLKIEKKIGLENIKYLHPDCGFALVEIALVKKILRNMRLVSNRISLSQKEN